MSPGNHRFAVCILALCVIPAALAQDANADKQKIRALKDWGKQGSAAIPKIAPYLDDASTEVRIETVKALIAAGTQRSLEPLIKALGDADPEVQIRAIDGILNFYLPGYVETGLSGSLKRAGNAVTAKFTDDTPSAAVEPGTPVRPEIVDALTKLTQTSSSMESRANGARALGVLRAKPGLPALLEALRSKDSRLIYESLIATQKIGDRSAGARVTFLVRDLDQKVQLAAIETVGLLTAKEAVPELKRVLENTSDKKVRRAALTAMAQIADPSTRALIANYVDDKDEWLRSAAAEGLGRIRAAEDKPRIESLFADEGKMVARLGQAFALARYGNIDMGEFGPLGYLFNQVNQKAWRGVAVPYISELAAVKEVRVALSSKLESPMTHAEKLALAEILGATRAKDVEPSLERLSRDEDPAVARDALKALRQVRNAAQ
jgi:HEAT repeat protein